MPKQVLFISYAFPPVGGAGVQRPVKFVKYLPQFGWHATVLTVSNPSVPVSDGSLLRDVPADVTVCRARTFEPSYAMKQAVSAGTASGERRNSSVRGMLRGLVRRAANLALQPDPQILWLPGAVAAGMKVLRERKHHAIIATAPPFSAFATASILARRSGLPLVLDYRDEWGISNAHWENKQQGAVSNRLQGLIQNQVLRHADAVLATTHASARRLDELRRNAGASARVDCIYNGFDPEDFGDGHVDGRRDRGVYRLSYIGTLWALTSVRPLVEAVGQLSRRNPRLAEQLEIVFAGRRTGAQQELVAQLRQFPCRVVEHAYVDHAQALSLIASSDGLCALLSDLAGAERVIPAKIFEYMASHRHVLAIAPPGELWDVLDGYPAKSVRHPSEVDAIAEDLAGEIRRKIEHGPFANGISVDLSRFDRRAQARQLAGILDRISAGRCR